MAHARAHSVDVVLLDLNLPDSWGVEGVALMRQALPSIPIAVLSGSDDPYTVRAALRAGADRFLGKDAISGAALDLCLRNAVEARLLRNGQTPPGGEKDSAAVGGAGGNAAPAPREAQRLTGELRELQPQTATRNDGQRESEANFLTFFETIDDLIVVASHEGRILYANRTFKDTLGYRDAEITGMHVLDVHPGDMRQEAEEVFASMLAGKRKACPLPVLTRLGTLIPAETRVWHGKWNGADCIFGVIKDLSTEQEAKQRFERLFQYNPSPMGLSVLPGREFSDVNRSFLKALGYCRDEVIGKTSADLGLFADPAQQASAEEQLRTDGRIAELGLQIRRKDGTMLDGILSGEVISSQGQRYFLTVLVDITARKRAEAELARISVIQRSLMCLATEFVNVPLERQEAAIDQSLATMGQLIRADRVYLFAYDFGGGVMSNTHEWCADGIAPEIGNLQAVPAALFPDWVEAHRRGELVHIPSVAALPADSNLRQVLEPQGIRSLIALPLMHGPACLGFVGFDAVREERRWEDEEVSLLRVLAALYAHFQDRRAMELESRDLQHRLAQTCDAAQHAARAKSLFLANMSHEIRTPLNAILGYAQIMERECRPCPAQPRLNAITRSGEHLLALLTDLLELVRSDAHTITLSPGTLDFHQLAEDVRLMFAQRPEAQSLALDVSHDPAVPRFICADQGKVRQVLVNLVGNAVQFTEAGGVRLSTSVMARDAPDGITIAVDVEDTGCGIPDREQELIFDIFEQAESGRKCGKGTGLGLPLSRRYARALGGDVTVTSRPGGGSCFRFTFRARAVASGSAGQPPRGNILRLAPAPRAYRLLLVDDDPASLDMLTAMLAEAGFAVETATSAARALHRLRQAGEVDMVLIDRRMPEMDGYEAIGRIRGLPDKRELRVLVVTASAAGNEREQALAAGANGYLAKPVRRQQLLEEIGRVAGIRYEYEQAPPTVSAVREPATADPTTMARLPAAQRGILAQALRHGNIRQLRSAVDAIGRDHAGLAAGLRTLVDAYDYDRLQHLLDSTTKEVGT
jgi:PAS domain S-box-containing protein